MKLLLRGHDDRYAVEQLQLALFPEEPMEPVTEPFSGDRGGFVPAHRRSLAHGHGRDHAARQNGPRLPPPARGGGRCAHPPPSAAEHLL